MRTKSALDLSNPVTQQLIEKIIVLSKPYVQLSKRLYYKSATDILPYSTGKIETIDLTSEEDLFLNPQDQPSLPPGKRTMAEIVLNENKAIVQTRPWTRGLIENVVVADWIKNKGKLENKNRFVLILLDSCLEIAFKDFIYHVNPRGLKLEAKQRADLKIRENLHSIVHANSSLSEDLWKSIEYFYKLRCSLYHEVSTPEITETDIERFREIISAVLYELHGIVVAL